MLHAPLARHRLFFALRLPIVLARQLISAAHWFGIGDTLLRPEHLHVTLAMIDDLAELDDKVVEALLEIGASIAADPFTLTLDRVAGSSRSIALRPSHRQAGLEALHAAIERERANRGVAGRAGYRFDAHVTLGYRDGAPFTERVPPVAWQVRDFALVHSRLGRTRHEVLGRWGLDGAVETQLALF